ncbi:hypothetical protein J3Q64DRAFT_1743637 [Phycomyces blakesleeanus]|uniref:RRM domain-containing protein n=1 Tax=Phycomyces blakesleeanus TaxID=4837 RepID=A0ABR3AZZ8_PHYBL
MSQMPSGQGPHHFGPGGNPPPGFMLPMGGGPPQGGGPMGHGPPGHQNFGPPVGSLNPSVPVVAQLQASVPGIPVNKQPLNKVPSRTVYVSNLNEDVKIDVLKNTLRTLFKQYGEVLDVVAHGNIRMRGQAFVAFPDEESATKSIKELQHFTLYGKPLVVQYARNRSDVHAKADGDYPDHYKRRLERKEEVRNLPLPGSHKPTFAPAGSIPPPSNNTFSSGQHIPDEYLPPNSILFLQNLPEDIEHNQLVELFQRFPGFIEVRMIPTKKGIAFVEYTNEMQASIVKTELANHTFDPEHVMKVTFARK